MRLVLSVGIPLVVAGCMATGPVYSPATPPRTDQALFYLYRVKTDFGAWVPMKVEVNGEEIGILPNNSFTSAYVAPGPFSLSATRWQDFRYPEDKRVSVSGAVEGGKTYYFKIYQVPQGTTIYTYLEQAAPDVADVDLKVLKRAEAEKK